MQIEEFLNWVPVFIILIIIVGGLVWYSKIRSLYKIQEMKQVKVDKKNSESFGGAINELIDSAPKNLAVLESEIATLQEKALKENLTPEQTKSLLSRLESERDMLRLASKYGHLAKPLGGSVGKLLEKVIGGIGGM